LRKNWAIAPFMDIKKSDKSFFTLIMQKEGLRLTSKALLVYVIVKAL